MRQTACLIVSLLWLSGCSSESVLPVEDAARNSSAPPNFPPPGSAQAVAVRGDAESAGLGRLGELGPSDLKNWQVGPLGAEIYRERPKPGAAPVGTLDPGTSVQVVERTDEFWRIVWLSPTTTDRHMGWVAEAALQAAPVFQAAPNSVPKVHRIPMH